MKSKQEQAHITKLLMGSLNNAQFPPQFSLNSKNQKEISKQILAALEEHGCFMLKCEDREYFKDEMMLEMENLFRLDSEIKAKNLKPGPYYTYVAPNEMVPYYESMSVDNGKAIVEEAEKFTRLMWPQGNEKFCETLSSTNKDLLELAQIIMDVVVTGFGLDKELISRFSDAKSVCRMSKYMPPENGEEGLGLPAHVDGTYITILCQNDVHGLKIKSKDGTWFNVNLEKGSFIVFAGQPLKAWSNGKVMAPVHKVIISGEKDRYSYAFLLVPEEDEVVEPQPELVDHENPARFKPFLFRDFLAHVVATHSVEGSFEEFAGI